MKNLYAIYLNTHKLKQYNPSYVIAESPSEAEDKVMEYLKEADMGFDSDRQINRIEFIANDNKYGDLQILFI